jgi:hypothetical protein
MVIGLIQGAGFYQAAKHFSDSVALLVQPFKFRLFQVVYLKGDLQLDLEFSQGPLGNVREPCCHLVGPTLISFGMLQGMRTAALRI